MSKKIILAVSLFLLCAVSAYPQNLKTTPEEVSKNENKNEGIKFTIANLSSDNSVYLSQGESPNFQASFEKGEKIIVLVTAFNPTNEKVSVVNWDYFETFVPYLENQGKVIPYLNKMKEEAEKNIDEPPFRSSASTVILLPFETKVVEFFDLTKWYGQLESGFYNLKIFYRSRGVKENAESESITFEVKSPQSNQNKP